MPEEAANFAERLVRAREKAGFKSPELAQRIGVAQETLSGWERGETRPRANRLVMLAGLLGVSPGWLLAGDGLALD